MKILGMYCIRQGIASLFSWVFCHQKRSIDGNEYDVTDGDAVVVPAGAEHNVSNTSAEEPLKLYTIYSPAHHKDGVVRATKAEAQADGPEYDGQNTE
jgi:oxalate decarboxylase/phosphoglucose isomerase-like protein (cupin superfamily)